MRGESQEFFEQVLPGGPGTSRAYGARASVAHYSQCVAIWSIAEKICGTRETLRKWVRQVERDQGRRRGLTGAEREQLKALERENRELRRASEIVRKASAYFAQAELDCRRKT